MHYNDWLARRWNIVSDSRDNASMKFVTLDTLPEGSRTTCGRSPGKT